MNARRIGWNLSIATWGLLLSVLAAQADPPPATEPDAGRAAARKALEEFNSLIGAWRGVGQPQRNSSRGSWSERGAWTWDFKNQGSAIHYDVTDGKLLASGVVTYDARRARYVLEAVLPDKSQRRYVGRPDGNKFVFETSREDDGPVYQIQITRLNEKRTLVLYQSRQSRQEQFTRIAEVGYTREGTRLAIEGAGEPECIVTGGRGTMSTVYKGQTYYFCCTGCRDAFHDDPDGVIAEAAERVRKKQAAPTGKN